MRSDDFDPAHVIKFSKDALSLLIVGFNEEMEFHEICEKPHISYINRYLDNKFHTKAKTIVVENDYVDRHYLEDYAEYYARCFHSYERSCTRVHFFSDEFSHPKFLKDLANNSLELKKSLKKSYLGFLILRPMPHTFLGKLSLSPYSAMLSKPATLKMITRTNKVSLFGIDLEVEAAPFVEKDEVVGRCAASAIWSLLATHSHASNHTRPSLSSITKAAFSIRDGSRTFPADRLTTAQIARSLQSFGLEPTVYDVPLVEGISYVQELVYAYVSNNIPVLLGGTVHKRINGSLEYVGDHLVCVTGYRLGAYKASLSGGMPLKSNQISRLYVHDDRLGPYVGWQVATEKEKVFDKSAQESTVLDVWQYEFKDNQDNLIEDTIEYFVPDQILVGADHKIRVSHTEIYDHCAAFRTRLIDVLELIINHPECVLKVGEEQAVEKALDCKVSIKLTNCHEYKASVQKSKSFISYNGVIDKNALLLRSIPKHLWVCEFQNGRQPFLDLVFDATDISQGNSLIGLVVYNEDADIVTRVIETLVQRRHWAGVNLNDRVSINFRPFAMFYKLDRSNQRLNTRYGALRPALRQLAKGEVDPTNNIVKRDVILIPSDGSMAQLKLLDNKLCYIWVIDSIGNLVLGEDIDIGGSSERERDKQGHPTLIDGRYARLGGELFWVKGSSGRRGYWEINSHSAAYSNHLERPSDLNTDYLNNVKKYLLKTIRVQVNTGAKAN